MSLHEELDDYSFNEYKYEEEAKSVEELSHKKRVKRLLEERLERKRLQDEFKDDFDELNGEFNWADLEK